MTRNLVWKSAFSVIMEDKVHSSGMNPLDVQWAYAVAKYHGKHWECKNV